MTVIIGPNNAGKSRVLKDIAGKTTQETSLPGIVVNDVEWTSPSSLQEFREAYSIERYLDENYQWIFRTLAPELCQEYHSGGIDWPTWYEQNFQMLITDKFQFVQQFGKAMVAFLTTEHRLQLVKKCASAEHDKQEANLLQALYNAGSPLEISINGLVKRAFGKEIKLDFTVLQRLLLRVGDSFSSVPPDPRDAKPIMSQYDKLDEQGDGIRSFVGILTALLAIKRNVFLIDEPESFLHPPQAFRIGEFLAEQANSSRQIILATHSTDLLRGILSKTTDITIIRIDRKDKTNFFHTLNPNDLQELVKDPLLSSARVLDGLFYTGVVVVEADSDARFYQTACNKFRNDIDFHFVNADNKQTVSRITETYQRMGVRCVGIVDFDVLNNHAEFEKHLKSLQLSQEEIQNSLNIRQKIAEAAKEIPANERLAKVQEQMKELIISVNEMQNKLFTSEEKSTSEKEKLLRQLESRFKEIADTTKNWKDFKARGREALPAKLQSEFDTLWQTCAQKGLFINPCGELESMLTQQGIPYTTDKKGWITQALQLLPRLNVNESEYPWQFIKTIHDHLVEAKT
ncbi:AAA family ATPase [Nostoc sp. LEGE 06077]|uniref:ATP-dependent nuclease n=1 Tax=Nostoc sp. LEGE 06077 TaxID=915325 RepID=UPI00187F6D24|nr:AAA family ATPase [Nostoc sp. LEGE 06077]MBE9205773.1 AAA family ATPase [Nostoc sp. LEGE 06077]